jgi:hypothetical protein
VLIKQDDDAFSKAQTRIQNTERLVSQLNPTDIEKSIFLQAEGFYQYRFTPPKKSTQRYLAEAASAITDFPGFQSLAGSLDMEDLRFRAPDSAV